MSGGIDIEADRAALRRRWLDEGTCTTRTLLDEFAAAAGTFADARTVFHSAQRPSCEVTLAEIYEQSRQIAAGLQGLGVSAGDTVALQVPNWLEGVVAHAAALLCGATVLPIVGIYGPAELEFILRQSGAGVFVVPERFRASSARELLPKLADIPTLRTAVVIGDVPGEVSWNDLRRPSTGYIPPATTSADRCLLVYTSGTVAEPKGVQHSHETLLAELRAMGAVRGLTDDAVHLAVLPTGHVAGVLGILRTLVLGANAVLMDAWDAGQAALLVERHRVTSSVGAPVHLAALLEAGAADGRDLTSLREYMTGAAAVPPALVERAERAGISAYRTYGSSEHPTISSGSVRDPLVKRSNTDGRVCPGTEVRIIDEAGHDIDEGEIVCRGPEQFLGYLDSRLDADVFLPGGWFRTGDVGTLDADGYLRITDRMKDIIVRGGENISSKEVEDTLATHAAVQSAAAIGKPDERLGERVCVFVELVPGTTLTLDEIVAHFVAAGLARQKIPEDMVVVDALPRTAAGKVQKFVLREQFRR